MENRMCVRVYPHGDRAHEVRGERALKRRRVRDDYLCQHSLRHGVDALDPQPQVEALRHWCKRGAYSICSVCYGLQPRVLNERDLRVPADSMIPLCNVCAAGHYIRPQWMHIPMVLRGLQIRQVNALSPLVLLQGELSQHPCGYRRLSRFTRLRWKVESFPERLAALPVELQRRTEEAHDFLVDCADSAYGDFIQQHMQHRGELAPYDGIVMKYVENALWPDLYPFRTWCDSCFVGEGFQSAKASFMAKAWSAVLDYAQDLGLAQFTYDRWIYCLVTSRFAHAKRFDLPMSYILNDKYFTTDYVQGFRALVIDVIRQIGMPQLYQTYAPAEWFFPLHEAIIDMMKELGVSDYFELGGPIAVNIVHSMQQLIRGFLFGGNGNKPWAWRSYVFRNVAVPSQRDVVTFLIRQELQLGADRSSQGRHAWHWHILSWHKCLKTTEIEHYLRAHIPADSGHVAFWADQVQGSHMPFGAVEPRRTHWDAQGRFVMHYPLQSHTRGLRPFLMPMLLVTRGHSDVQMVQDPASAIEYLSNATKYVTKNAGLLMMPECGSGWGAVRILTEMHRPSEAELWTSMCKQGTCYVHDVGSMRTILAPALMHAAGHVLLQKYFHCRIRPETMSFLEWLRAYKTAGPVAVPWKGARMKAVAMQYSSPMHMKYFEQLLLTRIPCRSAAELFVADACASMPEHLRAFCALLHCQSALPQKRVDFSTDASTQAFFTNECTSQKMKALCIPWISALREHVKLLTRGEMDFVTGAHDVVMLPDISCSQRVVLSALQNAVKERRAAFEAGAMNAPRHGIFCLEGPPGTGKSTVLMHLVQWCREKELEVCMLTSTGLLAETYRQHGIGVSTDTFDGGTGYGQMSASDLAPGLIAWTMIMVDEVFSLRRQQLDHLNHAWLRSGRWPIILMCGDPQQLRPWDEDGTECELVCHCNWWKYVQRHTLYHPHRQCHADFAMTMAIRTSKPTLRWLNDLCETRLVSEGVPDTDTVRQILRLAPATVFLAVSRAAVSHLNSLCSDVLFHRQHCLCRVRTTEDPLTRLPLYYGEKLVITYNIDKERGLVNGKVGSLVRVCTGALFLHLDRQGVHAVPQLTLDDGTYYPVMRGHALTVAKSQGATLPHVTLYMEEHMRAPAVGYVALTRVRSLSHLLLIGFPERAFFTPNRPLF